MTNGNYSSSFTHYLMWAPCLYPYFVLILWQEFLIVMTEVSKSHVPCIHQVIPYMDSLFDALDYHASDEMIFPSIHLAAIQWRTVLQRYYGKTTNIYSIESPWVHVSHPCSLHLLILQYFYSSPASCYKMTCLETESGLKSGWQCSWLPTPTVGKLYKPVTETEAPVVIQPE